jgi:RimJ/RimL family protein N-acetyltransferase
MILTGERLTLREFSEGDFEAVHAYAIDLEVVRYKAWGPNTEG